ncbi:MAG: PorT family protein, partial [Bacteroidetes bacterium]|nr:PorT family protein [Bacteroidota bacterium]
MKTKLLSLIAVLLITHAAMAQFHVGIRVGTNISKIEGKSFKQEFNYGYLLGGFAEIGLGNKFSLQPEVLFNQYTTTLDSSFNHIYQNVFSSDQSKVKLNYLSVPILLSYKLLGPISIQAGPQFGVLIDQSKTLLQNGGQAFKNGDFSMLAGVQIKVAMLRVT